MALISVGEDSWAIEHEGCEKLYREIMEQFTLRSQEQKMSVEYARISSSIRYRMKQFSSEVFQLKEKIMQASLSKSITQQEAERRSRMVEVLRSKERQMKELFSERNLPATSSGRGARSFADMGVSGWRDDDEEENAVGGAELPSGNYSINDVRQQQQTVVKQQDEGLEVLSKVISRQKELAKVIGNEVDIQNDIIDDLTENMENTDTRIRRETKQIGTIVRKDKTWVYWMIIILLFIAIVVLGIV
ncbi:syntaxin-8 [Ischnura elegans]|uniref:syntaxin-8 n=1 Tax=Ischnura elegans TaxID=197161 RepID=UPI001ED89F13|nr:syntaxin-8 [Ischnura elegans]